jgi:hypothetical protein
MTTQQTFMHFLRLFCLSALLLFARFGNAQENLVVNPNCEIYDTCPDGLNQLDRAVGYWNFNTLGTPDYFNICGQNQPATIPSYFGYQLPLSNDGYIHSGIITAHKPGFFATWAGNPFGFEYGGEWFGGTLTKPLELKKIYYIEFYVSFSKVGFDDGFGGGDGRVATDAFDLVLLKEKLTTTTVVGNEFEYKSDIISLNKVGNIINDTLNWVKISACFRSKGDELFFGIGSMRDTSEINLQFSGGSYSNHYAASYYFDNFALYECDTCCLGQFPYEDHVTVSSNPGSTQNPTTFSVLLNPNTTGTLALYDSAGRLVAKEEFSQLLTTYTLPVLAKGVYQYALTTSSGIEDVGKVLVVE